jgi:antitoxin component YwqK of YwqJK toxin-antitoxin module
MSLLDRRTHWLRLGVCLACAAVVLLVSSRYLLSWPQSETSAPTAGASAPSDPEAGDSRSFPPNFTGTWTSREGKLTIETEFLNGKEHGEHSVRDEDGTLLERGQHLNGERVGEWESGFESPENTEGVTVNVYEDNVLQFTYYRVRSRHENGRKFEEGQYTYGDGGETISFGDHTRWHENGQMSEQFAYDLQGRFHGAYTAWYKNGQMQTSGTYEHGIQVGVWMFGDESGQKTDEAVGDGTGNLYSR